MSTLANKVVVVTGASSGIGEAVALALGEKGANVVLAARRADRVKALAKKIVGAGGHAVAVPCDVSRRDQVKRVIDTAMEDFGRLDILFNNAGIMPLAPMSKCRIDDWDDQIDINVKGLLYGIGYALPIMLAQKTGHIVNVSSTAGRILFPGATVYCATKHAVHIISDGLRSELAERSKEDGNRIRVTIIAPGVVRTELADSIRDEETRALSKKYYESFKEPLTGEDVAAATLYALQAPPHVNVSEVLIRPQAQVR